MRELASGIDALYLSGRTDLPARLLEDLERLRVAAQEANEPQPIELAGHTFMVEPGPFGKYRYRLSHPHGLVGVTQSQVMPQLRVQPYAEFLHAVGPVETLAWFDQIGEFLAAGEVWWSLNRLDLFCDVQGWSVDGDERRRFVCRAQRRDLHEEGEALTGFEFGRRTTNTVVARIYDKTLQVKVMGHDWWPDIWGPAFDRTLPVWRVELEVGRQGLTEFQIDTPADGIAKSGGLWRALTEDWLTFRDPTADTTKSRWPVSPDWIALQGASLATGASGLARIRAGMRKGSLRVLMPLLVGQLASVAAILDLGDLDAALGAVRRLAADDEIRRGIPFTSRITDKVNKWALL